jgi:hypothetical protein
MMGKTANLPILSRPLAAAASGPSPAADHVQDQPGHVDGDVAFAAVDFLGGIPAPAGAGNGVGGADGLGVDDRGGGLGLAPGGRPDLRAQLAVQLRQGVVIAPGGEVAVDGLPGREVRGQIPPGAPGPEMSARAGWGRPRKRVKT